MKRPPKQKDSLRIFSLFKQSKCEKIYSYTQVYIEHFHLNWR